MTLSAAGWERPVATPDALDEHFYDVFLPSDDIGLDGKLHIEIRTE